MTLREKIVEQGWTVQQYIDAIDMLVSKGVSKGCFQDYALLSFLLSVITNLDVEMGVRNDPS